MKPDQIPWEIFYPFSSWSIIKEVNSFIQFSKVFFCKVVKPTPTLVLHVLCFNKKKRNKDKKERKKEKKKRKKTKER